MFHPDPSTASSYSVTPVPSGPQQGVWYLTTPPLRMDLKSQILPDLRGVNSYPVGSAAPPDVRAHCPSTVTLPSVNACASTSGNTFSAMVSNLWTHEKVHYDRAVGEASQPDNDLLGLVEAMTASNEADLRYNLQSTVTRINNDIFAASKTADNGTHGPYSFYAYVSGSSGVWQWVSWTLQGALH